MRAGVYTRLSRAVPDQTSTARQEADCRRLAEARGWEVVELFEDVDLSAYSGVKRPAYERMLAEVRRRQLGVVVVWKVDRLARSLREFMRVTELLHESDVALVSVNESLDTSSPMGRAMLQIVGVFAELESATIGLRVRNARDWSAREGRPHGGPRRFGYTTDMRVMEPEADAVRWGADELLRGGGTTAVAKQWNAQGCRTTSGNEWRPVAAGRVLRSPYLAALRTHRGEVVGDAAWEPILDRETHYALTRQRGAQPRTRSSRLLTGLLRCSECGTALVASSNKGRPSYWCPNRPGESGCGSVSVDGQGADDTVRELALAALRRPEVAQAVRSGSGADTGAQIEIQEALAASEQLAAELGEDVAARRVTRTSWQAANAALIEEQANLRRQLAQLGRAAALRLVDPAEEWKSADLDWRRRLLAALFERVLAHPTRVRGRFDPARLEAVPWG